jgi:hypothetical protein
VDCAVVVLVRTAVAAERRAVRRIVAVRFDHWSASECNDVENRLLSKLG